MRTSEFEQKLWTGTHKEEILVNEPIKTRRLDESAYQNTPKHQIIFNFLFTPKNFHGGACSTPGLEVIRDPAMDRRSAKTDR